MMKKKECIQLLRAHNFYLLKDGGKHEIWTNGDKKITLSKSGIKSHNTEALFKVQLRGGGKARRY